MKRLLLTYLLVFAVLSSGCSPFLTYTLLMDNTSGVSSDFSLLEQDSIASSEISAAPARSSVKSISEPKSGISSSVVNQVPEMPQNAVKDYYYSQLNDVQKVIYEKISTALGSLSKRAVINSAVAENDITRAYYAYRWDNPQVFYLPSSYQMVIGKKTEIKFEYSYTATEIETQKKRLDTYASGVLSGIDSSMSDFQKELLIHNYIVDSTLYSDNADDPEVYTIIGILNGSAVCEGYAKMMKYLLDKAGISTIMVTGFEKSSGNNVAHAWNIALVDGQYYHVDATFNDTVTNTGGKTLTIQNVKDSTKTETLHSYQYFNLTDAAISNTHEVAPPDPNFSSFWFAIPECKSVTMNYYRQTGSILSGALNDFLNKKLQEIKSTGYYFFYIQSDTLDSKVFRLKLSISCTYNNISMNSFQMLGYNDETGFSDGVLVILY